MGGGRVFVNMVAVALGRFTPRFSGLILVPIVARTLGSEDLGAYQLSHILVSYAWIVVLFGMTPLAVRDVAQRLDRGADVFASVLGLRLLLAGAAAIGLSVLVVLMGYPPSVLAVTAVLSLNLPLFAVHDTAGILFQAHGRLYYSVGLTALGVGLYLVLGLIALALGGGIAYLAVAHVAAMTAQAAATLALISARFCRPRLRLDLGAQRSLLAASLPFFVHGLATYLINRADVLVLSALQPLDVVGWYLASYVLLEAAFGLPVGFGQAIYPSLAQAGEGPPLRALARRSLRFIVVLVLPLPGLVVLAAPDLVRLLYGDQFIPTIPALQILIWSLLPVAYNSVVGGAIFARGGQADLMRVALGGLAANVALNLLLIPPMGHLGAATATLMTFTLVAVVQAVLGARYRCSARLLDCAPFAPPAIAAWLVAGLNLPYLGWPLALAAGLVVYGVGVAWSTDRGPSAADPLGGVRELFRLSPSRPLDSADAGRAAE